MEERRIPEDALRRLQLRSRDEERLVRAEHVHDVYVSACEPAVHEYHHVVGEVVDLGLLAIKRLEVRDARISWAPNIVDCLSPKQAAHWT